MLLAQMVFPASVAACDFSVVPDNIDFGDIVVPTTSLPATITITNDDVYDITIEPIIMDGPDANQFTIVSDNASNRTLPPGAHAIVTITFSPASAGDKEAGFDVIGNDLYGGKTVGVILRGCGLIEPDINVTPTDIPFGNIPVDETAGPVTVTIKNYGSSDLTITNVALDTGAQFSIASNNATGAVLPPGCITSAVIDIEFTPDDAIGYNDTLRISSNDPNETEVPVTLSGTGYYDREIQADRTSIDFGDVLVGVTAGPETVTISNNGYHALTISSVTEPGAPFSSSGNATAGTVLGPNDIAVFDIGFTPTDELSYSDALVIESNGGDVTIPIDGAGYYNRVILVMPTEINFGYVTLGTESDPETVTISNNGYHDLTISSMVFDLGGPFSIQSQNATAEPLPPGGTAVVNIVFSPTHPPRHESDHLLINSNDPDDPTVPVYLEGTGVSPQIQVSPSSINFDDTVVGITSDPKTVTISNIGTGNLSITSFGLDTDVQFSISSENATGAVLGPDDIAVIDIEFTPDDNIDYNDTLRIGSNDLDDPEVTVALSGAGYYNRDIEVAPTSIPFGDVLVGITAGPETVTISNIGTGNLTITSFGLDTNVQFSISSENATGAVLGPDDIAVIDIEFTPDDAIDYSDTLRIGSDDPVDPEVTVALSGAGYYDRDIEVAPTSIPFGDVLVDVTAGPVTVTISNDGYHDLSIISFGLDTNVQFSISSENATGAVLGPDNIAVIDIEFTPDDAIDYSDTLRIGSDDPVDPEVTVALNGAGYYDRQIQADRTSIDFGDVLVGVTAGPETVTISNNGYHALTISSVTEPGAPFSSSGNATVGTVLGPDDTAVFDIEFTPTDDYSYSDSLVINSNGGDVTIPIDGAGYYNPDIQLSRDTIDFGDVGIGTTSPSENVTITNVGDHDLTIDAIHLDIGYSDDFTLVSGYTTPIVLAPDASHNVTIEFSPDYAGHAEDYLYIDSDDPDEGTVSVYLEGTGVEPDIHVTPAGPVDFGEVIVGTTSDPKTITISNVGEYDLNVTAIELDDAIDFFIESGNATPIVIAPDTSHNVNIVFTPQDTGDRYDDVQIYSNDPDNPTVTVALEGRGIVPEIYVTPQSVGFGLVELGSQSADMAVTVTNVGDADLEIGDITIDDTQFSITIGNISGETLAPTEWRDITLVFEILPLMSL